MKSELLEKVSWAIADMQKCLESGAESKFETAQARKTLARLRGARMKTIEQREFSVWISLGVKGISKDNVPIMSKSYLKAESPEQIKQIEQTILLLAPLQASVSWSKFDADATNSHANFGKTLGLVFKLQDDKRAAIETRFLALCNSQIKHVSKHLLPLLQLIRASDSPIGIAWAKLYEDLASWDSSVHPKHKWARDFFVFSDDSNNSN